ncbi:MAG TPA: response regulator, partial [Pseudomonadales bacterium]
VDDEPGIRRVLSRALTRIGHSVLLATTGEEACQVLESSRVDVVMMDLRMPSMSGQTLYHVIASRWPDLVGRVVVMSGDPEATDHESWLGLHDLPVLPKPFDIAQLVDLVTRFTESPRREANGPQR